MRMRVVLTFLLTLVAVVMLNVAAWAVLILLSGFPYGPSVLPPDARLLHDILTPPSRVILLPVNAAWRLASWFGAAWVVVAEAACIYLLARAVFRRRWFRIRSTEALRP